MRCRLVGQVTNRRSDHLTTDHVLALSSRLGVGFTVRRLTVAVLGGVVRQAAFRDGRCRPRAQVNAFLPDGR
jgi:hypothetical protein